MSIGAKNLTELPNIEKSFINDFQNINTLGEFDGKLYRIPVDSLIGKSPLDLTESVDLSTLETGVYRVTNSGKITDVNNNFSNLLNIGDLVFLRKYPYNYYHCILMSSIPIYLKYIDKEFKSADLSDLPEVYSLVTSISDFINNTLPTEYKKHTKYTLIVDSIITEENQLLENNYSYIQFESDTQGNPFSYNKLLIEVKFPSVITSQIYPYFRVNSNGHFNSNTFGYGVKNIDRINGIIEKLPNGHIACEFTFQNGAYFGVNKIGNINTEKYSIIQENFTGIRFMLRQEDMIIPVGTTMKVWGVE